MAAPEQPVSLVIIAQLLEKCKWAGKKKGQKTDGKGVLSAVVVDLHHLLHSFDAQELAVVKPFGGEHFVGCMVVVKDAVFRGVFVHIGASQHLQKAKLQLIRDEGKYVVEGFCERVVTFEGKPGDQVKVQVDIVP